MLSKSCLWFDVYVLWRYIWHSFGFFSSLYTRSTGCRTSASFNSPEGKHLHYDIISTVTNFAIIHYVFPCRPKGGTDTQKLLFLNDTSTNKSCRTLPSCQNIIQLSAEIRKKKNSPADSNLSHSVVWAFCINRRMNEFVPEHWQNKHHPG